MIRHTKFDVSVGSYEQLVAPTVGNTDTLVPGYLALVKLESFLISVSFKTEI